MVSTQVLDIRNQKINHNHGST